MRRLTKTSSTAFDGTAVLRQMPPGRKGLRNGPGNVQSIGCTTQPQLGRRLHGTHCRYSRPHLLGNFVSFMIAFNAVVAYESQKLGYVALLERGATVYLADKT